MPYQFNIHLTEEDYAAFNYFTAFESPQGKRQVRRSMMVMPLLSVVLITLLFLVCGFTAFTITYSVLLGVYSTLRTVFFRKILARNLRKQLRLLKKDGKLPFDPESTVEFHEDHILEITATQQTRLEYAAIERICVISDQYLYLYRSSVGAFILPLAQIRAQVRAEELLTFLMGKCGKIERFEGAVLK